MPPPQKFPVSHYFLVFFLKETQLKQSGDKKNKSERSIYTGK